MIYDGVQLQLSDPEILARDSQCFAATDSQSTVVLARCRSTQPAKDSKDSTPHSKSYATRDPVATVVLFGRGSAELAEDSIYKFAHPIAGVAGVAVTTDLLARVPVRLTWLA